MRWVWPVVVAGSACAADEPKAVPAAGEGGGKPTAAVAPAAGVAVAAEERITWPDLLWLSNGSVRVGVSAEAGRVWAFERAVDGESRQLLWHNTAAALANDREADRYSNIGGDKVWPALQAMWARFTPSGGGWPPDGTIDGEPWTVLEQSDRHVVLASRVNTHLGARVVRRVDLAGDGPQVRITNRVERVAGSALPLHVWTVSQVHSPPVVLLDVAANQPPSEVNRWLDFGSREKVKPFVTELEVDGAAAIAYRYDPKGARKIGTFGRWIAGVWDDVMWVQVGSYDPAGSYPDRSNVQVYSDGNYTELELLSPQQHPQPGDAIEFTVTWVLLDRPADADTAALVRLAREAAAGVK